MGRDFMNKDYRTISQILEDDLKSVNEVRYTNIYNRIKGVKGLKRKDLDMISAIDPDILAKVVNSLDFLRDDVQEEVEQEITEASALDGINDIVKTKGAKKVSGVMIDMFTASMIQQVYNKVNDANKKKMEKANVQTLVQIAQKVMGMK